jgi:hypothetical protein
MSWNGGLHQINHDCVKDILRLDEENEGNKMITAAIPRSPAIRNEQL